MLWPPVCAFLMGFGLSQGSRDWMAKDPRGITPLFSNAVVFAVVAGLAGLALAELIIPHLVGQRSPETMRLVQVYLVNIPAALVQSLMLGLLEGARRFGWAGASRLIFFAIQAVGYFLLWSMGALSVRSAALTVILAQFSAMLLALFAVLRELKPGWRPSWSEGRAAVSYGLRYYPGSVADFTTMRLDQLLL